MSEPPIPEDPVIVTGWVDAVAAAEAGAIAYTDEQVPIIAGRMVPRNMDRAPLVEDGADLLDGTGWNQYDPATGDLVQMWRWDGTAWVALDMAADMIPVLDIGSATVGDLTGGRINVTEGPIVAGAPGGARVEITGDGLHAYDATGTETATIQGGEGVFVGGEFRTSDTLPGQVTLSNTAAQGKPGLSVEPEDATGYDVLPSIGPDGPEMHIRGGVSTDGNLAGAAFTPSKVSIYQNGPGTNGTGAWMDVGDMQADLGVRPDITNPMYESGVRAREQSVTAFSQGAAGLGDIHASPTGASINFKDPAEQTSEYTARIASDASGTELFFRPPGGTGGRFAVDAEGIWVEREKTPNSQQWVRYNLEETAQDSGWQAITLASGITGAGSPAWRNKGGVIYFRGTVDAAWIDGWNEVATNLPTEMRPEVRVIRTSPSTGGANLLFRMESDGRLRFYRPGGGAVQGDLSGLFYPLG